MFGRHQQRKQSSNPEQALAYIKQANTLLDIHQYNEALTAIEKAVLLAPDDPRNHALKAYCLSSMRHYEQALDAYDDAIQLEPNNASHYMNKGTTLLFMGHPEEALDTFDHALRLEPHQEVIHFNRARTLLRLRRYEEALMALERVPTTTTGGAQLQSLVALARGECLISLSRFEEALSALEQVVQLDPTSSAAWFQKGMAFSGLLVEIGQSQPTLAKTLADKSLEAFDTALRLDPGNDAALEMKRHLQTIIYKKGEEAQQPFSPQQHRESSPEATALIKGHELYKSGKQEEALALLKQVLSTTNDPLIRSTAYANMSNSFLRLRRYPEALRAAEQALELNQLDAIAYLSKGMALLEMGRYQESLTAFDESLRLDPTDAMTHCERGRALWELQRPQEALESSEKALRLRPEIPSAIYQRGRALFSLKRNAEAFEAFEKVNELDPSNGMAYVYVGKCLELIEHYDEAVPFLDKALRVSSNPSLTQLAQGVKAQMLTQFIPKPKRARTVAKTPLSKAFAAYQLVKEGEKLLENAAQALACFDKALQLDPWCDAAYTFKGLALSMLDREEEALKVFEQVLQEGTSVWALTNAAVNKGEILRSRRRYTEALACYKEVRRLNPNSPAVINDRILELSLYSESE
ncbi:hypothetical protein KSC_031740 [Ktedonobacter sp. SOSP1-52]|uniref:tetratricopeptide repeat protein n=1 Tax=Ktedonobacter sp. SOSP1-52 TaxID=2778366 RepID=UPI00191597A5|nr:tetratricopeptide repeat protein [Ktedonobacter sp. SOSP1-52]GHO64282.1 hypothetical protein KSC_031740 [Ktedonobacter sp. SOSP1-52]